MVWCWGLPLQESMMDFYWHYSGRDIIDPPGKESFFRAIKVAAQIFCSITEYIQVTFLTSSKCGPNLLSLLSFWVYAIGVYHGFLLALFHTGHWWGRKAQLLSSHYSCRANVRCAHRIHSGSTWYPGVGWNHLFLFLSTYPCQLAPEVILWLKSKTPVLGMTAL